MFLTIIRNKNKKECHNLNLFLLTSASTFWLPRGPLPNCKSDPERLSSSENYIYIPAYRHLEVKTNLLTRTSTLIT
jgi:hypothetical protein